MLVVSVAAVAAKKEDLSNRVELVTVEEGVYKLIYKQTEPAKFDLKIINKNGELVFEEKMYRNSGFTKNYDLRNIGDGRYTFQIRENNTKIEKKISFKLVTEASLSRIGKTKKVRLSLSDTKSKISIIIYDGKDRLIYQETVEKGTNYFKIYDLSHIRSNKITVDVIDQNGLIKSTTF
jgi:hypothetical protein